MKAQIWVDYSIVAQLRALASLEDSGTADTTAEAILLDALAKKPELAELVAMESLAKKKARAEWAMKWKP